MATFQKLRLSGSTEGRGIVITATGTATAQVIHTASNVATTYDEVWLYATNISTATVLLTVEWGDTASVIRRKYSVK